MSNQYTIYRSTDASAPTYNPALAGALITVLDACLVNGYGSQAAAGWTKPFTGSNLAAYLPPSGIRNYVRVDSTSTTGSYPIQMYETMSDVNTGTHPYASATNDMVPTGNGAQWLVAADSRTLMVFIYDSFLGYYVGLICGEFFSLVSNDSYRGILRAGSNSSSGDTTDLLSASIETATTGAYIDRGHTGVGSSVNAAITGDAAKSNSGTALLGVMPYPNPADGGAYLSPVWISDPTTSPIYGVRGRMRGFWHWLHPIASVNDGDTFSGTGDLSGKTFVILKPTTHAGVFVIETSATLETN